LAVIVLRDRKSKAARVKSSEDPVLSLFARIAEILLRLGLDAPSAERVLRRAFVLAAKENSHELSVRLTQSQIASMTGISRLEVRNLLKLGVSKERQPSTRVEQIVFGWRTDPKFLNQRRRPKPLAIKGKAGSFEGLAKKYGRDVTPKALRGELVRRGIATIKGERIYLANSNGISLQNFVDAQSDLNFIASYLGGYNFNMRRRSYAIRRGVIDSTTAKESKVIRQLAIDRFQTVLNSLAELSRDKSANIKKSDSRRIVVTAVVATEDER
jgi:hypothetical protein